MSERKAGKSAIPVTKIDFFLSKMGQLSRETVVQYSSMCCVDCFSSYGLVKKF